MNYGPKLVRREVELDFIRGLAILLVLDYHAPKTVLLAPFVRLGWANFGWIGVDVFFVLSGFLVGGLLVKEWKLRGGIDAKRFLIRRGFKIWPQYYFFLLALLLTGHRKLSELWGNLLNIQNYLGGEPHTWTLAVEEHAYLLLGVALAFAASRGVRMRTMFLATGAATVCGNVWSFALAAHGGNTITRTDTRMGGILLGLMLAMLYHGAPELFRRVQRWSWAWVGVLGMGVAILRLHSSAWWANPLSDGCADAMGVAVLLLLYKQQEGRGRSAIYRFVAWIGLYSYGIYLWHVAMIAPAVWVAHRLGGWPGEAFLWSAPGLLGIALGVAATKAVELPALRLRDRLFPRPVDSAAGMPAEEEKELHLEMELESVLAD